MDGYELHLALPSIPVYLFPQASGCNATIEMAGEYLFSWIRFHDQ